MEKEKLFDMSTRLKSESVISVRGLVRPRPDTMNNAEMSTGDVEIVVDELVVLNEAERLPVKVGCMGPSSRVPHLLFV